MNNAVDIAQAKPLIDAGQLSIADRVRLSEAVKAGQLARARVTLLMPGSTGSYTTVTVYAADWQAIAAWRDDMKRRYAALAALDKGRDRRRMRTETEQ